MVFPRKRYNYKRIVPAVFMILTLGWLTVSLPLVNAAQQQQEKTAAGKQDKQDNDSCNPFGNTTEEKNPGNGTTIAEEFLHEHDSPAEIHPAETKFDKCTSPAIYIAYHGELLSPPPEA